MSRSHRAQRRSGFTLVQLVAVLCAVFLLAALLESAMLAMTEKRHFQICTSNLRRIGMAMRMYADDNGGSFPPLTPLHGKTFTYWPDALVAYTQTAAVFVCPDDPWSQPNVVTAGQPAVLSYGYNQHIGGAMFMMGVQPAERPRRLSEVLHPARTVLVADAGRTPVSNLPPEQWPLVRPAPIYIGDAFMHDSTYPNRGSMPAPDIRHNGRANILWADGHVSARRMEQFYNAPDHRRPGDYFPGISPCLRPDMGCPQ